MVTNKYSKEKNELTQVLIMICFPFPMLIRMYCSEFILDNPYALQSNARNNKIKQTFVYINYYQALRRGVMVRNLVPFDQLRLNRELDPYQDSHIFSKSL